MCLRVHSFQGVHFLRSTVVALLPTSSHGLSPNFVTLHKVNGVRVQYLIVYILPVAWLIQEGF